jgi:hypothetical protein
MDPQERADGHPARELPALKKPRGCSLMLGFARNVVICGRVRRRKPFLYVLFYLCPCSEDSVSKTDEIQTESHKHFTSSTSRFTSSTSCLTSTTSHLTSTTSHLTSTTSSFTSSVLFDTCCIAMFVLSTPNGRAFSVMTGDGSAAPRTVFDLSSNLQNLSCRHLKLLLYQAIEPF